MKNVNRFKRSRLAVAILTSTTLSGGMAGAAQAQETQQKKTPERDRLILEEVVITGTPGGSAVRKLDASFAISTMSDEDILQAAPAHSADLLATIPGVWVEASGGVAGSNVDVRGLPNADGGTRFATVALNNMPVYHAPMLAFVDQTALFRIDETIERVEGLRGGPNPVYANGQPGMTANFILKEGGEQTEGTIKYSTSDYDLMRLDYYVSGKVTDDVYYMIGGYKTSSPGQGREAGFNSDKGDQLTLNLTWNLENGKINFFHRATDDFGTWYLPTAVELGNSYTQVGPSNRQALIPISGPDGLGGSAFRLEPFDLGEGRGWDGSMTGLSAQFEFDNGWSVTERVSLTEGNADTLGLVPQDAPRALNTLTDLNGDPITSGVTLSGDPVAGTALVQQFGPWVARKDMKSLSNDLSIAYNWGKGKLTVGQYAASWQSNDSWSLGNQKYYVLGHNGEQLASAGGAGEIPCNAPDVQTCSWSYNINDVGDASEMAFYAAVEVDFDRLTADIGARRATQKTSYTLDQGGALDGVIDVDVADQEESATAVTAGVNWAISDYMGAFVRVNSGFAFPNFNEYRTQYSSFLAGSDLIIDIDQIELGYKFSSENYALYATLFNTELDGQPVCIVGSGSCNRFGTETRGIELDGDIYFGGFAVNLIATFQDPEIVDSTDATLVGNRVQRQPKTMVRIAPSYNWSMGSADWTVYGAALHIGDRYSENGNITELESYTKVDVGVAAELENGLNFRLAVDNLTDEEGITEGDPRNPTAPNGRFILPRTTKLTVGYNF